ncbi:hypothetical protein [Ancylobacter lacus]|uniref:hypothetical protein n=1 Tax=Ancylobacter lacus TaxID=2579970 RepID=UPI001FEB656F|nr:hypothetical protein [Ancylobacter lacus]
MPESPDEQRVAAEYVAALVGELARIAHGQGWDTLRYLLEMAREEARSIVVAREPTRRRK